MSRSVEQLFLRYRDRGDADALARVFERTAPEVLRVALHLAPDPASAEDLLQATFVAAMESARAYEPDRPLVPWLLGILANQARKRRGRDSRRPDPSRLRAGQPLDPSRAAEDRELSKALTEAVDGLHEPYRQVLVLHLRHGLAPVEIADVLGRSPGTVRSQLTRGLQFLRNSLPVGFTAAGLGLFPGRGLAAVKQAVLEHAAYLASPGGALLGAFAMKKTTISLGGLLIVAALAAIVFPQMLDLGLGEVPENGSAPRGLATELPVRTGRVGESGPEVETSEAAPKDRSALEGFPSEPDAFGSVLVRLRWADNGAPAAGVAAYVVAWERSNRTLYRVYKLSDVTGRVHYEGVYGGEISVYTLVGGFTRAEVLPGRETEVEVRVPRGITVTGTVVGPAGAPVPNAEVWLCDSGSEFRGVRVTQTDAWGEFRVHGLQEDNLLGARSAGLAPSRLYGVGTLEEDRVPSHRRALLELPGPGCVVTGTVVDGEGKPLAGTDVQIHPAEPQDEWGRIEMRDGAPLPLRLTTGPDGTFSTSDLPEGSLAIQARRPGLVPARAEVSVTVGGPREVFLVLEEGVTLVGHVTDGAGRPLVDAHVESGDYGYFSRYLATTDARGNYRLEGLPPDPEVQAFTGAGRHVMASLTAAAGETLRWDPVLSGGNEIRGRLLDASGEPLGEWSVWAWGLEGSSGTVTTDHDGAFAFSDRLDEEHVLEVRAGGELFSLPPVLTVTGVRCGEELELRVPDANLRFGSIAGRIVDFQDHPVSAVITCTYGDGRSIVVRGESNAETGLFLLEALPPMAYRLTVQAPGHPLLRADATVHPSAQADVGALRLQRGTPLVLKLQGDDGNKPGVTRCSLEGPAGPVPLVQREGNWSAFVLPGAYRLSLVGEDFLPHAQQVVVGDNPVDVAIRLAAARRQPFQFDLPESAAFPYRLHLLLVDDRGEVLRRETLTGDPASTYEWAVGLGSGGYQIQVTTSTGLRGEVEFRIPVGEGPELPITVELR